MSDPRVDDYIKRYTGRDNIFMKLRGLLLKFEDLNECVKWNMPLYTYQNKNLIGLGVFKHFTSLWFYNGSHLKDKTRKLLSAQEGKTQNLRQWRFESLEEIDEALITSYIEEAIEIAGSSQKSSTIKPKKTNIPASLKEALDKDIALKNAFDAFPPYKQKEFIEYIVEAKRDSTKTKRLAKILPLIKSATGLNDKYRK